MVSFCPGGWQEFFTYFEPGHLKSKKNKQGAAETVVNYEYDDLYQLEKKDFPSGTDTEFETDAHGRRTNMKDASGEKRYSYDDADRLIEVVQGPIGFTEGTNENYKLEYTWNAASQRTEMTLTIRGLSPETWTYSYTDDGQLLKIMSQGASIEPEFLDDGRLSLISLPNGAAREFFYQDTTDLHAYVSGKNRHLRKTLDKKSGGATICSFAYELDPAGNRLSVTDKDGKYKAFGYDPNYQLTAETKWSAKAPGTREGQEMYLYDPNGNRLLQFSDGVKKAYEYGPNNEMTEAGDERFVYDEFGNLIAEGNGPEEFEFFYDFESHMIEAKNTTQSTKDEFGYDGDGRRMWAFWDSGSDPVHFVYDELETAYPAILAEYTLVSGTFTIKSLNTHAPGIGLIYTDREGTFRYFHFDALGSTAALTDETETVTDTYAYTAFGVPTSTTGSSVNPFRYVGQYGYYED
ncbi:MAG TPA: hypothetical protein VM328_01285, partial [Fimbriimonadaceae bacterium]|nr:hypothetical protein [Fimbriimonadaceae bacterium]